MTTGKLSISFKKNQKGNLQQKKAMISYGANQPYLLDKIPTEQIAEALLEKISAVTDEGRFTWEVEFEIKENSIEKLREKGAVWDREETEDIPVIPERHQPQESPKTVNPDQFHNPYNFVPALPRDHVTNDLGDHKPVGHGKYERDRVSGRIAVKLTTVTPLLIPDASLEKTDSNTDHKTYPVRRGADGKPYLPPTSIKGMLRSAYEAITNSRLAVFEKHDARLAYRMPANIGLQMVPARIENGQVILYPGTSQIGSNGKPSAEMYAAWLPRYDPRSERLRSEVRYPDGSLPQHGDHVKFWAEKYEKTRNQGSSLFTYWKVREVVRFNQNLGNKPPGSQGRGRHQPKGSDIKQFEGYVYITNKNIDSKHDERIFIVNNSMISLALTDELKHKWQELISNYQEIHTDDIRKGRTSPPALNCSRWSRHIVGGEAERNLDNGMLCYAHVKKNGSEYKILDLYPVMITRGLFETSPGSLLHPSLRPTEQKNKLSPADRVFGWVNQNGKGSYKGHLRVHSVTCLRDDAIEDFGSESASFPLTILGQPKPQQARFYCADDSKGTPIPKGERKEEGYKYEDQSLRGRKVYPHHQGLPDSYWSSPTEDRTQAAEQGHYQEYRRPKDANGHEQKDDQNRSIKSWVKPKTNFEFDIDITNLSPVELGALLWLLSSPDIHFHRLGGAKPLGFGSVWLDINWDKSDLRFGQDWVDFYKSLRFKPGNSTSAISCIDAYKQAVTQSYGDKQRFEQVSFIAAFCRSTQGFSDRAAIRYPRVTPNPTPEGEAFKWFTENEKENRNPQEAGSKLSLSELTQPRSLPTNPIGG